MLRLGRRSGLALAGVTAAALLTGCGGGEAATAETSSESVLVEPTPSDAPVEIPGIPAPAATLSAPSAPSGGEFATTRPETFPQFVPPDVLLSGIAVGVSSTEARRGQQVEFAAQAAPELTGHTAYLVTAFGPDAQTLATGEVGAGGLFTLSFEVRDTTDVVVVVAQASVEPDAPYNFDDMVARSEVVRITRI